MASSTIGIGRIFLVAFDGAQGEGALIRLCRWLVVQVDDDLRR